MSPHHLFIMIAILASPLTAIAAEAPKEELLWPADHAANQGDEPRTVDSPEWTERVTKSPTLTTFLPDADKRNGAAIVICAAGLVADAFLTLSIDRVFPDMTSAQERLFAAWLAWAYGIGLVSGIWPARMPRVPA